MIMNSLVIKIIMFIGSINVYADEYVAQNFCHDVLTTLKLVSVFLLIIRLCVPIFIIFMGAFDLYNTVTSGKSDDLNKGIKTLGKRCIIGLIVFFIPTIINLVVNGLDKSNADYKTCLNCLNNPKNCNK